MIQTLNMGLPLGFRDDAADVMAEVFLDFEHQRCYRCVEYSPRGALSSSHFTGSARICPIIGG